MKLEIRNPYSGDVVAVLEHDEGGALDAKIDAAVRAQREWRRVPLGDRIARDSRKRRSAEGSRAGSALSAP